MFFRARCLVSRTIFRARLRARYLVSHTMSHFAHDVALRARYLVSRKMSRFAHDIPRKMSRFAHDMAFRARCLASRKMWLFTQGVLFRARYSAQDFAQDASFRARHSAQDIPRKTSRKVSRFAHEVIRSCPGAAIAGGCCFLAQVLPELAAIPIWIRA